jgi:signal transduction histidine kinase
MNNPLGWIFKSIRRKAILGLLAILLSTVFLISFTMASQASKFIFNEVKRRAATVAGFVASEVEQFGDPERDLRAAPRSLERMCQDPDILFVTLLDQDGKILASGCSADGAPPRYSLPMSELYNMDRQAVRHHVQGDILEVYRLAIPAGGQRIYIAMGFDVSEVDLIVDRITRLIAVSALVVYLMGLLALVIAVNRMTTPIEELSSGMMDIGSGRIPERVPVKTNDELGTLTTSFNRMIEDLESYRDQVQRYQKHLEEMVRQRTDELNHANEDLKLSNEELQAANEKLLELDKLKSNFLGIATHELKTPITVIEGYLDSLVDGFAGDLSDVQSGIVEQALISCNRMADLVSDMLDMNRIESGKLPIEKEDGTLAEVVERVAAQMQPLLRQKDIHLVIESECLDTTVHMDKERIFQVFVNLIGNAIKFTPEGGTITVSTVVNSSSRLLETTVTDTGIGIAGDELPLVFDEFAQVGPPGKEEGTGLGLAICRGIVEAHHGEIRAQSVVGEGSRFTFSLPVK